MERIISGIFSMIFLSTVADCTLDIMVNGKEMQKLFFGSTDNIKIVDNGNVSSILERNLLTFLPPIQPKFSELQLQFASATRLYYHMYLTSSDTSIMRDPTVTLPHQGRLQTKWIGFKIRFPCTKRKTGMATLGIVVDFFHDEQHLKLYKTINLSMRRHCEAAPKPSPNTGCRKKCDLKNFRRKFCLSDFVARVKVAKAALNEADTHYLVHIPRKRIFKRPRTLLMNKKNQIIKSRGTAITCDCKPLQEGKKYLLFGRENRFDSELFVDNYSMAMEIRRNDKKVTELIRNFRKEYRNISCPFSSLFNDI